MALCHRGVGWAVPGGTVWPWMGPCWWHCVALDGAMPGGTVWPWMGLCWCHRVALDRAMLVALRHRRLCHICCPRVPLYGTVVTLRTRPCNHGAMPGGTVSPWLRPCQVTLPP